MFKKLSYKSVIFLNGNISKKIIDLIQKDAILIAADGAYNRIEKFDLDVDYVIGDLDSLDLKKKLNKSKVIKIENQDFTDFEKCLNFVHEKKISPTLILGMTTGEIDHVLGNFKTLYKYSKKLSLFFLDSYLKKKEKLKLGFFLKKNENKFNLKKNTTISLLPFSKALISSNNLFWELKNSVLSINKMISLRNKNKAKNFQISLLKGAALAIFDI